MAAMVLEEMTRGEIPVLIGRVPEFYGPGRTQSFTNALVTDKLKDGKEPRVPVRDDTRRTLIWTPDASRGLAIFGNTPDAYGQTWHLPCCDERPTYKQFVTMACEAFDRPVTYKVIGKWTFAVAGLFSPQVREIRELLARYEQGLLSTRSGHQRGRSAVEQTWVLSCPLLADICSPQQKMQDGLLASMAG